MHKGNHYFLIIFLTFLSFDCVADIESTATLPRGMFSPNITYGYFSGISERFNSSGLIQGVAAQYHVELSGKVIGRFNSDLNKMIESLNSVSKQEKLGDELMLGTLDFKASPVVDAVIPTLAYGVTDKFSIGLGIPLIHYRNDVQVAVSGTSNAQQLQNHIGGLSDDLNSALGKLENAAQNLPGELQSVLAARGYKPLRSIDTKGVGDLQVAGVYRYFDSPFWKFALRPYFIIPTGKQDDPDDLVDMATGGQPAVGLYSIHDYLPLSKLLLTSSLGYQANLQDTAIKRVPLNNYDLLPDQDRRDLVRRHTGNVTFFELGSRYHIIAPLTLGAFYDLTLKDPDWYDGDRGWDYNQLSQDTVEQIHQLKGQIEFSTISWYRRHVFSAPLILTYVYGNTITAVNAPLVISNQLMIRMFF
jgi:hypothetical protein